MPWGVGDVADGLVALLHMGHDKVYSLAPPDHELGHDMAVARQDRIINAIADMMRYSKPLPLFPQDC